MFVAKIHINNGFGSKQLMVIGVRRSGPDTEPSPFGMNEYAATVIRERGPLSRMPSADLVKVGDSKHLA